MTVSIVSNDIMANHICACNLRSVGESELVISLKCSPSDCADRIARPFRFQALFVILLVEMPSNRNPYLPIDLISGQKIHAT